MGCLSRKSFFKLLRGRLRRWATSNKHFSQSSFNRESAVDVDFEKAEEERWKRHSYAANETQQSSDDVFDNPRHVLALFNVF